jgi:predicted PurR-regulated permease PerM
MFVVVASGGALLLASAYAARVILVQLTVATVLALAAEPLVQAFERRGLRRGTAVGLSFGLVALAVICLAYLLVAPLVDETRQLVADAPRLVDELTHGQGPLGFLEERFQLVERTRTALESRPASATAGPVFDLVGSAVHTGAGIVFVAFLALFVQLGGRQWFDGLVELAPLDARSRIRRAGDGIARSVAGYVTGNLLISVVAGAVTTVVLLATGVPYAVPLGLFVAILDLIPLVGATLGTVVVAGVALTQGVTTTVIVVAVMCLYQQVENHTLQPLVYNRTVKLSPLAIALSVALGAELGGVAGALLGIPIAGALKAVGTEVVAWRRGDPGPAPPERRAERR